MARHREQSRQNISRAALRRLPLYLAYLDGMVDDEVRLTDSDRIGRSLDLSGDLVRRDLSQLGRFGAGPRGYDVNQLHAAIKSALGLDATWDVIFLGATDAGTAVLGRLETAIGKFHVVGIFDPNPDRVGKLFLGHAVQNIEALSETVRQPAATIAVLAADEPDAASMIDLLVHSGIKAILNYTGTVQNAPPGVRLLNHDPFRDLCYATHYLYVNSGLDTESTEFIHPGA